MMEAAASGTLGGQGKSAKASAKGTLGGQGKSAKALAKGSAKPGAVLKRPASAISTTGFGPCSASSAYAKGYTRSKTLTLRAKEPWDATAKAKAAKAGLEEKKKLFATVG